MRIAYRRLAGPVGVTREEVGARGIWWEKRRALLTALRQRGHKVDLCNRLTIPTSAVAKSVRLNRAHDLLILEFGSHNAVFYGQDLEGSYAMCARHQGPIVFLCDDPDLGLEWGKALALAPERWTLWMNATRGHLWTGLPAQLQGRVVDFPFSSLMPARPPHEEPTPDYAVYLGRPQGRTRMILNILAAEVPFRVYCKPKDWTRHTQVLAHDPPDQPHRADFYAEQRASLVLADNKHKTLGWRTGRAYHAVLAGCPAMAESDHQALRAFAPFRNTAEIKQQLIAWADPRERAAACLEQQEHVASERALCERAMERLGL